MTTLHCSLGFRVKSGHAIAIALGGPAASPIPLARAIVELSDPNVAATRQPFHADFGTAQEDRTVIARLVAMIETCARRSVDALLSDERLGGRRCRGAGIVVGSVIDPEKVGNLHIRAHASEGRLFRTVLEDALRAHRVPCTVSVEKTLLAVAVKRLGQSERAIGRTVGGFGRVLGSPWRAEEKAAATVAWMALNTR